MLTAKNFLLKPKLKPVSKPILEIEELLRRLDLSVEEALELLLVDEVTGLYNTRYLKCALDREIAGHQKAQKPFSLLFIDVDEFKKVNDSYGHVIGTRLLCEVGEHLRKIVRQGDLVFRYGGDEFVCLLSGCDLETAKKVSERIRASLEREVFLKDQGPELRTSVSVGAAQYPIDSLTESGLLDAANRAMYQVKKANRMSKTV